MPAEYTKLMGNIMIFSNVLDLSEVNSEIIKLNMELSDRVVK